MDDFLATSIRYYAEFNLERQAPRKPDDSAEEAFAAVVKGIKAFMDEATRVDEEFRQLWRETVDSFQRQREPELKEHAAEVQGAVMNLAKELLPKVQAQEPLPLELLQQLNAAVQRFESRYSGALGKSDLLPEQLLTAAPGSKLYPGLLKKVEAIFTDPLLTLSSVRWTPSVPGFNKELTWQTSTRRSRRSQRTVKARSRDWLKCIKTAWCNPIICHSSTKSS